MADVRGRLGLLIGALGLAGGCFAIDWDYQVAPPPPPPPPTVCGNGKLERGEECDDGNRNLGDGCAPWCELETCPRDATPVIPSQDVPLNGTLRGKRDNYAMSCQPSGRPDVIYALQPSVTGTLSLKLSGKSLRTLSVRSTCDRHLHAPAIELLCNNASPGEDLSISFWATAAETYYVLVDGDEDDFMLSASVSACGDGVKQGLEECDDPNDATCKGCVNCTGNGEFWDASKERCYRYGPPALSFWAARETCVAWGGDLAAMGSQDAFALAQSKAKEHPGASVWVGGFAEAPACSFLSVDYEPWYNGGWAQGEPNYSGGKEYCAMLFADKGYGLNDADCNQGNAYLCERTPGGSCGNGKVQPGEECDSGVMSDGICDACKVQCGPDEFEDPRTRHCYKLINKPETFWVAWDACKAYKGYLAKITSDEEKGLQQRYAPGNIWIGGYRDDGNSGWKWTDQAPICYTAWEPNEPDSKTENCIEAHSDGKWNNVDCQATRGYLCEREP